MDIFEDAIIANGYSFVKKFGGNTINYEKNNFEIQYTFDWEHAFYLSGDIDIPTPYASITTEQIVAEFEQHTPFLTPEMIASKYAKRDYISYYLGRETYDYYFFIEPEIVDNKLEFWLGIFSW